MDTKQAIDFLEKSKMIYVGKGEYPNGIDEIIKLLKRIEMYGQIKGVK